MTNRTAEPPFWLVWCEDGGEPRQKHSSPEAAEAEAERLARLHPGKSFCVMWPSARFKRLTIEVERFDNNNYVPF